MIGKESRENLHANREKWREAIDDTKNRMEQHKIQGQRLRAALRVFEDNLLADEPWPGRSAGTDGESIPA